MQIKADLTREALLKSSDPLAEACYPIEKLKTIAGLLVAYPHGPWEMEENVLCGVSHMIEDAVNEIEYLIEVVCEGLRRERKVNHGN